ncbi:ubiquinol-cytochrome c reductase subunit 7 [Aulographum hederae CBS 113979]|uniref:Cytochrome b-c1 complex subunit 7 n=1 Tax=Aulographum hederae CBS 113979 TaxID=1176131 RepID=A0A6G1H0Z2_9PEZI|nr:ubiquinol-cytochrome c reductase subunit 7 [Aulographum hederae CBS 113979]
MKKSWLRSWMVPMAKWWGRASGYRQLGLRLDDLIPEDNETVQLALKRLPPKEAYDRVFRLRRAIQCSITHHLLPKEEQTKEDEDLPYLTTIIEDIEREQKEKKDLDAMVPTKK